MTTIKLNRGEQTLLLNLLNSKSVCDPKAANLYEKIFSSKPDGEHAALCAVAEAASKTVRELEQWHNWAKKVSPDYADSTGCAECESVLENARQSIANLAAIRNAK